MSLLTNLHDLSDSAILNEARRRAGLVVKERVSTEAEPKMHDKRRLGSQVAGPANVDFGDYMLEGDGNISLDDLAFGRSSGASFQKYSSQADSNQHNRADATTARAAGSVGDLEGSSKFGVYGLYHSKSPDGQVLERGTGSGSPWTRSPASTPGRRRSTRDIGGMSYDLRQAPRRQPLTLGDEIGPMGAIRVMLSPGARGSAGVDQIRKSQMADDSKAYRGGGVSSLVSPPGKSTGASLRAIARAIPEENGQTRLHLVARLRQLLGGKVSDARAYAAALAADQEGADSAGYGDDFSAEGVLRPWVQRHVAPVLSMLLQPGSLPDPVAPAVSAEAHSDSKQAVMAAWRQQRAEWECITVLCALMIHVGADVSAGSVGVRTACVRCVRSCCSAGVPALHPSAIVSDTSALERLTWPSVHPTDGDAGDVSGSYQYYVPSEGQSVVPPHAVALLCAVALSSRIRAPTVVEESLAEASGLLSPAQRYSRASYPQSQAARRQAGLAIEPKDSPLWAARQLLALGRDCTDAVSHACLASVLHSRVGQLALLSPLLCGTIREAAGVDLKSGERILLEAIRGTYGSAGASREQAVIDSMSVTCAVLSRRAIPPKSAKGQVSGVVAALASVLSSVNDQAGLDESRGILPMLGLASLLRQYTKSASAGSVAELDAHVAIRLAARTIRSSDAIPSAIADAVAGHACAASGLSLEPLRSVIAASAESPNGGSAAQGIDGLAAKLGSLKCVFHALSPQQCADVAAAVGDLESKMQQAAYYGVPRQQQSRTLSAAMNLSGVDDGVDAGRNSVASVLGLGNLKPSSSSDKSSIWMDAANGAVPATGGLDASAPSTQFFVEVVERLESSLEGILLSSLRSRASGSELATMPYYPHAVNSSGGHAALSASVARAGFAANSSIDAHKNSTRGSQLLEEALKELEPDAQDLSASVDGTYTRYPDLAKNRDAQTVDKPEAPRTTIMYRRRFLELRSFLDEQRKGDSATNSTFESEHARWVEHAKPRLHVVLSSTHCVAAANVSLGEAEHGKMILSSQDDLSDALPLQRSPDAATIPTVLALAVQLAFGGSPAQATSILNAIASIGCEGIWSLCGGACAPLAAAAISSHSAQQHLLLHARSLRFIDYEQLSGRPGTSRLGASMVRASKGSRAAAGSLAHSTWIADADTAELLSPKPWYSVHRPRASSDVDKRGGTESPFRHWLERSDEVLVRVCEWDTASPGFVSDHDASIAWNDDRYSQEYIATTARVAALVLAVLEACMNRSNASVKAAAYRVLAAIGPASMLLACDTAAAIGAALAVGKHAEESPEASARKRTAGSIVVSRVAACNAVLSFYRVLRYLRSASAGASRAWTDDLHTHLDRCLLKPVASSFLLSAIPLGQGAAVLAGLGSFGRSFLCGLASSLLGLSRFEDWPEATIGYDHREAVRLSNPSHARAAICGVVNIALECVRSGMDAGDNDLLAQAAGLVWHVLQARGGHARPAAGRGTFGAVGVPSRTVCSAIDSLVYLLYAGEYASEPSAALYPDWMSGSDARYLLCGLLQDPDLVIVQSAANALASIGNEGRLVLTELLLYGVRHLRRAYLSSGLRKSAASAPQATRTGLTLAQVGCVVEALGGCKHCMPRPIILALHLAATAATTSLAEGSERLGHSRSSRLLASKSASVGWHRMKPEALGLTLSSSRKQPVRDTGLRRPARGALAVMVSACKAIHTVGAARCLAAVLQGTPAERARDFRRTEAAAEQLSIMTRGIPASQVQSRVLQGAVDSAQLRKQAKLALRVLNAVREVAVAFGDRLCGGLPVSITGRQSTLGDHDGSVPGQSRVSLAPNRPDRVASVSGPLDSTVHSQHHYIAERHPSPAYRAGGTHTQPELASSGAGPVSGSGDASGGALGDTHASIDSGIIGFVDPTEGMPEESDGGSGTYSKGGGGTVAPAAQSAARGYTGATELDEALLGDALRLSHLIMGT